MSKTPFEIRLELLNMAKDMLSTDYFSQKERLTSEWHSKVSVALEKRDEIPAHPQIPPFPSTLDIIEKAKALNAFVSNA